MSDEPAGRERFAAAESWEKQWPHKRRVHWRTQLSVNGTDAWYLMLILSSFSDFLDCLFTGKTRWYVLSGDCSQKLMERFTQGWQGLDGVAAAPRRVWQKGLFGAQNHAGRGATPGHWRTGYSDCTAELCGWQIPLRRNCTSATVLRP